MDDCTCVPGITCDRCADLMCAEEMFGGIPAGMIADLTNNNEDEPIPDYEELGCGD